LGVDGIAKASSDDVTSALTLGQAMAAWACQFHGARGGMYESSKQQFTQAINAILEGDGKATPTGLPPKGRHSTSNEVLWCDRCSSEESKMKRKVGH
jgi:hypothetical protein